MHAAGDGSHKVKHSIDLPRRLTATVPSDLRRIIVALVIDCARSEKVGGDSHRYAGALRVKNWLKTPYFRVSSAI